jgi:hypothetical protein
VLWAGGKEPWMGLWVLARAPPYGPGESQRPRGDSEATPGTVRWGWGRGRSRSPAGWRGLGTRIQRLELLEVASNGPGELG